MSAEYVWGAIFIMMGVTYISRIIPFLLLAGKPVPRWFKTWLTYVPTAIFGALVLPDVFLPAGSLDLGLNNLYLWSTVIIFPLVYKTKSLGLACFWGIGLVIEHSLLLQKALLGGGGLILIYLAWQLLHAQVQTDTSAYSQPTLWQTATLAFTVTWFNPQAVIDGTLMLGAFRSSLPADTASLFISGVAAASCLWFFGLTGIFKTCCQNLRPSHLQWINRICGAVIFVYALKLLYTFGQML